jgi:hypothetical protein
LARRWPLWRLDERSERFSFGFLVCLFIFFFNRLPSVLCVRVFSAVLCVRNRQIFQAAGRYLAAKKEEEVTRKKEIHADEKTREGRNK